MTELMHALGSAPPGRAPDLACGSGRHSAWLRERGWEVIGIDLVVHHIPGVTLIQADLKAHQYAIQPDARDLIERKPTA